jgi:hypothetical protein
MAGILKHRYTNPHADVAGSTKTQASHWNDFFMAIGGVHGDALTRDTSDATYGMKWTSGGVAGVWQAVPFSAANFAGVSPITWTVASGDVSNNRYTLIGQTLIWSFYLTNSTLGGTVGNMLTILVPGGKTLQGQAPTRISRCQNVTTYIEAEVFNYDGSHIGIRRVDLANLSLGAFNCGFQITMEVFA